MTTPSSSRKTHNLESNTLVSLLVHDWISHRPPTLSQPGRSPSPARPAPRSGSLAELLLGMNTASLSRISTTINGVAELIPSGSEEEAWYKAQHVANNTFSPGGEDMYSTSPGGEGLWGGGGLEDGAANGEVPTEGDGGTKCYLEGAEVRVVVVKVRDGRIADWKGQVRDWAVTSDIETPTINASSQPSTKKPSSHPMSPEAYTMALVRDPTGAEIAKFLATRTGAQMVQLMRCIKEPAAQAAFTAKLLLAPPAVSGRSTVPEKARKALNAFVGFRCYYITIPMFKQWPMKKLSNLIGLLWEADPNKSLWSLMTKAWSTIRDQIGKDRAPLDQFFNLICPHLNLSDPASYLEIHGWDLNVDKEGDPTISRNATSKSASIGAGRAGMALSVEDIITYVQSMGYAHSFVPSINTTSSTFLGQSVNSSFEKNNSAIAVAQGSSPVVQGRVLARNKRRTKRQIARDTGYRANLERDITNAHKTEPPQIFEYTPECYSTTAPVPNFDPNPFYDGLTGILSGPVHNNQCDAGLLIDSHLFNDPGLSGNTPYTAMNDFATSMPSLVDHEAFRLGANEYVTLPTFYDVDHA
ncbi:DNA binding protein with alpha box domain [Stemphylium lycopersici]|nr:DNA binding protein with alpha box domain [Stemphylium lycopersici]